MMCEDIHLKAMECEDIVSFVVSFSFFLSHRNHRTVKWAPSEQSQKADVMLNPNPMSSSEDNERKSDVELDESAMLVAQVKLSRVSEIRPLDMRRFLSDPGSFRTNQVGLPPGYKYPTPYTINWWLLRVSARLLSFESNPPPKHFRERDPCKDKAQNTQSLKSVWHH